MNEKIIKDIWELGLATTPKMVLLSLAYTTNKEGYSQLSLRSLCRLSGCSKGSLAYVLKALELSKAISREQQKTVSGKDSDTVYKIIDLVGLTKDKYQNNYHKSRQYIAKEISSEPKIVDPEPTDKLQVVAPNSTNEIQRHRPRKMSWI